MANLDQYWSATEPPLGARRSASTRLRRRLVIAVAVVCLPVVLFLAAGAWALRSFYESNGTMTVTNRCPSTIYVEAAGTLGWDGFTLHPGDHVTIQRPHTEEILVWRETAVNNADLTRLPILAKGEDMTLGDTSCPT
ncbi:MAG: hypothetical protein AB7Q27_22250 [Acidimicrobiia bacterium]